MGGSVVPVVSVSLPVGVESGQLDDLTRSGAFLMTSLDSDLDLKRLLKELIDKVAGRGDAISAADAHEKLECATNRC